MDKLNKGFAPIIVLITVLLVAGLGGYVYFRSQDEPITSTTTTFIGSNIIATTTILVNKKDWSCGDLVTFTYKGELVTYETVESQARCWLDRNLGASQVATAYNDSLAYGDLFQWGRGDDGHQARTSGTTAILSSTDVPGHSTFIKVSSHPYDWRSPQNDDSWQGDEKINNICPDGWRVPTAAEWNAERVSWISQDYNGAFVSPLKLTVAGRRYCDGASLLEVGINGYYWSSSVSGDRYASNLAFYISSVGVGGIFRATGNSVRCIKD